MGVITGVSAGTWLAMGKTSINLYKYRLRGWKLGIEFAEVSPSGTVR
jgi:hypothetical protein